MSLTNFAIKWGYVDRKNNDYYADETDTTTWQPEAGIIRQGHGLIGRLGGIRKFDINDPGKTLDSVYPLQLTVFVKDPLRSRLARRSQLIDTGYLIDDFLLESLVSWKILRK